MCRCTLCNIRTKKCTKKLECINNKTKSFQRGRHLCKYIKKKTKLNMAIDKKYVSWYVCMCMCFVCIIKYNDYAILEELWKQIGGSKLIS